MINLIVWLAMGAGSWWACGGFPMVVSRIQFIAGTFPSAAISISLLVIVSRVVLLELWIRLSNSDCWSLSFALRLSFISFMAVFVVAKIVKIGVFVGKVSLPFIYLRILPYFLLFFKQKGVIYPRIS